NRAHSIDLVIHALLPVKIHQGMGFSVVRSKAFLNQVFPIVRSLNELRAAPVANALLLRSSAVSVVNVSATWTHQPSYEAVHQIRRIGTDLNDEQMITWLQLAIKGFGLLDVPRITVKDKTLGAIRSGNTFGNNSIHNIVTDQFACVHLLF